MSNRFKSKYIVIAAIIGALYTVLTVCINAFGLANGAIQVRISEALTILPCFTSAAIPGLAIGCLISNIITGCLIPDIVFGTFATFIGAIGTYVFRKKPILACSMPILANTIVVPLVLKFAYGLSDAYWFLVVTIFIGEFISCGIFGLILYRVLKNNKKFNEMVH